MLTKKQHELLLFIHEVLSRKGVSPSFDEMKEALNLRSKSGIHRLVTGLEERGFIRRLPHRARALEILRLPESASQRPVTDIQRGESARFAPNVIQGNFAGTLAGAAVAEGCDATQLPLYGRIAAGTPIEALRDNSSFIEVPVTMLGRGDHYALQVDGDSMEEAGILDGDTVLIQRTDSAENGSIVVALIDEQEATLKRLRRKGGAIALEPANKKYETRIFPPERIRIQGQLIGLMRRY